ncbi:MAG: hypothetical protein IJK65_02195 [Clostridiales bacterium]|nr:hypothetical protein [Clostridiales bacterium]
MARCKKYTTDILYELTQEYINSLVYSHQITWSEVTAFIKREHPEYKKFSAQHFYRDTKLKEWREKYNEELANKYTDKDAVESIISDLSIDIRDLRSLSDAQLEIYCAQKNQELHKWARRFRSAQLESRREAESTRKARKRVKELEEELSNALIQITQLKEKYKSAKAEKEKHAAREKKLESINRQLFDELHSNHVYEGGILEELPPQAIDAFEELMSLAEEPTCNIRNDAENEQVLTSAEGDAIRKLRQVNSIEEES